MLFYNKTDEYAVSQAPGKQQRILLAYVAASSLGKTEEYLTGEGDPQSNRSFIREAQKQKTIERLEEVPEGKDIIQITYNPYHKFVVFHDILSNINLDRPRKVERFKRFESKTFKQVLTLAGTEAGKSKGKSSKKDWVKTEGETFLPFLHSQVSLSQGVEPTHLLKAESLQDDLNWYLSLKGIDPVVLVGLPDNPTDPMGALDANDIKKINTIYSEDFEKYGYTKL